MKKQTKLVAVLSTASLLAIGASMTSFAATGWTEEDGTWVYYNRDGERATDEWKKSGNSWYYLDSNGEMAIDQLIEDGDDYYYVDINGVMATNQWVAIENEDAGEDDEPDQNWYYFQANGKALTNGDNDNVSLKTINGKKYAFDDEGKMLWGWVDADNAEHIDDSEGDAFKEGDYYFGGSDDGAMTVGWLQVDITYDEATDDDYKYTAPVFNDDEDQTRWFYFKSNGKKVYAEDSDRTKDRTINGRKYAFDEYGAMVAEWSLDEEDLMKETPTYASGTNASGSTVIANRVNGGAISDTATASVAGTDGNGDGILTGSGKDARYTQAWRYFNSVEDGSRVSRGWFKVVPAEYLNDEKYDDDEEAWYYADGSGSLYAGEFKTINGKKYAFRNDGRMINGLKFIWEDPNADNLVVAGDDDDYYRFDSEEDFLDSAVNYYEPQDFKCYYFGGADDGAMRTGKTTVEVDGENHNFYFEKSGGNKGAGITGEEDDKLYQSGMLLEADSDEKYVVVRKTTHYTVDGSTRKKDYETYEKLEDAEEFMDTLANGYTLTDVRDGVSDETDITVGHVTKKAENFKEAYTITAPKYAATATEEVEYILVNTSGKIIDTKSKNKDGNDYVFVVAKGGQIQGLYVED